MQTGKAPLLDDEGNGSIVSDLGAEKIAALTDTPQKATEVKGATAVQTGINLLNELEGSGLLGVPYGIMLAGWGALACMIVVGIMAGFTGYILAKCMYEPESGRRVRDSYASIGKACFGPAGEQVVLLVLFRGGFCMHLLIQHWNIGANVKSCFCGHRLSCADVKCT